MSVLIKNASYVIRDAKTIEYDKDILIEGTTINEIGNSINYPENIDIIDAKGSLVMPGLINSHTHLYQNLLKGMDDRLSLNNWIQQVTFPLCSKITNRLPKEDANQFAYLWALLAGIEAIKSGTTTVLDMDLRHLNVIQGWKDLGLRGVCARTFVDRWVPEELAEPLEAQFQRIENLITAHNNTPEDAPLISVFIGPSAPFTCSEKLLRWVFETAEKYNTGIQIHVSETAWEVENSIREVGMRPVEYLNKIGFLSHRTSLVHCVHLNEKELEIVAGSGATIVHCPKSNMKLGSGIAPITEMFDKNILVSLGTDGAASNDLLDMFEEMRFAAMLQKVRFEDAAVNSGTDVFQMATVNGAKTSRINSGTIDKGKLADLTIIDMNKIHLMPLNELINTIVYCVRADDVESVIINGKIVMKNREITTIDELSLKEEFTTMMNYFNGIK